jgi:glucose-specific phosphotransferase system IIA component
MNIFKPKDLTVYSPLKGQIIPLSEVKDEVFSQAMMGPGIAVFPSEGHIFSPFDGQVKFIFPTKHALGLLSSSGVELLIHIGIDTVNLEGKPFTVFVKDHQKIKKGQPLADVDLTLLAQLNIDPTVVLVLTSAGNLHPTLAESELIEYGAPLIYIIKKS